MSIRVTQDDEAYLKYPKHKKWFNKLRVAEMLGYDCGPSGVSPTKKGKYIVRPIMNISGMGVGARVQHMEKDEYNTVEAGYFWCEYFEGVHYTANYRFVSGLRPFWEPKNCWRGYNDEKELFRFHRWERVDIIDAPRVPREFNELSDVHCINVEFKGDKPIEVHLRVSQDPDYDIMIPVWKSWPFGVRQHKEFEGYTYIESYDDADGQLEDPRLGFLVK